MDAFLKDTKTTTKHIGDITLEFRSDMENNKEMDTKVSIKKGDLLCWISGESKKDFINYKILKDLSMIDVIVTLISLKQVRV